MNKAHQVAESVPFLFKIADRFRWERNLVACVLCELFCSFFLMYGGLSINAVQTIQNKTSEVANFKYGISMNWGVWLMLTNYLGNALSGPHCNPAFSFAFFVLGALTLKRFILYTIAQFIGCYFGALFVFIIYFDGISDFDGGVRQVHGHRATADIFATYPKDYLSVTGGCFDQFFTTGILCIIVLGVTDARNRVPKMAQPAIIGIALWGIIAQWSHNCGAALNPARDFGPRLMTLTVGYGWGVISYNNYKYFWIPIVMPMFGAVAGGYVYKACLGDYLPALEDDVGPRRPRHQSMAASMTAPPPRIPTITNFHDFLPNGPSLPPPPPPATAAADEWADMKPTEIQIVVDKPHGNEVYPCSPTDTSSRIRSVSSILKR